LGAFFLTILLKLFKIHNMKVLLTGANGFVAYYIIQTLLQNNVQVIATTKTTNQLQIQHANLQFLQLDFTNAQQTQQVITQAQPTHIIHAGAISKPDDCEQNQPLAYQINVQGTINILQAAQQINCHVLFISTDFVFNGLTGNYTETNAREAVNYYGQTKILAEDAVMAYTGSYSIARIALVYGKPLAGRNNIITTVKTHLQNNQPYQVFTDQLRTPTYVQDVATAIQLMLQKNATGIYHISGNHIISPYQMAIETANFLKLDASLIQPVTRDTYTQPALRPLNTTFITNKAVQDLGFVATSFANGLAATLS
jgi:dTDP-4-dehydrorhamnose reductase